MAAGSRKHPASPEKLQEDEMKDAAIMHKERIRFRNG
jgi:hypothetical protein